MSKSGKSDAEEALARQREARDRARAGFATRLNKLREEMTPDAIAGRLIEDRTYKTQGVVGQAMEIANDNRGVVAGTVAALAMWAARRPMGRGLSALVSRIARRKAKETN